MLIDLVALAWCSLVAGDHVQKEKAPLLWFAEVLLPFSKLICQTSVGTKIKVLRG